MATMIELIKELRATTGAGMMDCKRALEATNMDIDLAKIGFVKRNYYCRKETSSYCS